MNAFTDRRSMLRVALTASAAAAVAFVPAVAASHAPDLISGRIDALKTAEARIDALRDIDDDDAYEEACRAADAAFDKLTETPPVTIPGMRALLEFLDEWCGGNNGDYYDYSVLLRSPPESIVEHKERGRLRPPFLFCRVRRKTNASNGLSFLVRLYDQYLCIQ